MISIVTPFQMHRAFIFLPLTLLLVKNAPLLVTRRCAQSIKHFLYIGCAWSWLHTWVDHHSLNHKYLLWCEDAQTIWALSRGDNGGKIFTGCPRRDPSTQNLDSGWGVRWWRVSRKCVFSCHLLLFSYLRINHLYLTFSVFQISCFPSSFFYFPLLR